MPELYANQNGTRVNGEHASPMPAKVDAPLGEAVDRAVARCRDAQQHWARQPLETRIAALQRAAKEMLRRRGEAIELSKSEMGKVEVEGLFDETLGPLDNVSTWAKVVRGATSRRHVSLNPISFPGKSAYVDAVPRGVVGISAPWNFPIAGLYRSVFPALMTGNGVVLKPSEYTPRSGAWFVERLADELPEGLVQSVQGDGHVGGQLI